MDRVGRPCPTNSRAGVVRPEPGVRELGVARPFTTVDSTVPDVIERVVEGLVLTELALELRRVVLVSS